MVAEHEKTVRKWDDERKRLEAGKQEALNAQFGTLDGFLDMVDRANAEAAGMRPCHRSVQDIQRELGGQLRDGGTYSDDEIASTIALITSHCRSMAEINGVSTAEAMESFGGFHQKTPDEINAILSGGGQANFVPGGMGVVAGTRLAQEVATWMSTTFPRAKGQRYQPGAESAMDSRLRGIAEEIAGCVGRSRDATSRG